MHFFKLEELHSIFIRFIQTLDTPVALHDTSFSALARIEERPHITLGQRDRGSSGNLIPPSLLTSGLGMAAQM